LVLNWADVETEIWRAVWQIPDRNNKSRLNTYVNRPVLSPNAEKWLNIGQIIELTDIYWSITNYNYNFQTLSCTLYILIYAIWM